MWFNLVRKEGTKAEILVYGAIGTGWFSRVDSETIAQELNSIGAVSEIDVRINSPGGSVFEGIAIYNTLKNHKAKVNVIVDGMCASIATVIAMAGDTITMGVGTKFMIHNPLTVSIGESKVLKNDAKVLEGIKEDIIDAYMSKVKNKTTREKITQMMDDETYLSAGEALKYGFITDVADGVTVPDFVNYASLFNEEKEIPFEEQAKNFINAFKNFFSTQNKNLDNEIGKNENIEKGKVQEMTKDEIMKNHKNIYDEIKNEGKTEERERIKSLDNLLGKGGDEIVNAAKYENHKTANDVALDILNAKGLETKKDPEAKEEKQDEFLDKFNDKKSDSPKIKMEGKITDEDKKKNEEYADRLANKMKK